MLLRATLLTGMLASVLPLVGFSQAEPPAVFKPRFFAGLGVAAGTFQTPYSFGIISPVPTLGIQLRPRWAVQISGLYSGRDYSSSYPGEFFFNGKLQTGVYSGTSQQRLAAVPILVRYTLSRRPERRLQADLLSGFAVVHSIFRGLDTTTDSTQVVVRTTRFDHVNTGFFFLLGPGLRYQLGQHLDLTGDFVFNFLLINYQGYPSSSRLAAAAALGLRYRFGRS